MTQLAQALRKAGLSNVRCPYCGAPAPLVTGKALYPHRADLSDKLFYQCAPCDAYVGCHPGSEDALGPLADAPLRAARLNAHKALDALWKKGPLKRHQAYAWLAEQMGVGIDACHIGKFDIAQCERVVMACDQHNATSGSAV